MMVFNPLKKAGQLKRMRDQAKAVQRELAKIEVFVEKDGIAVSVTGEQKIKTIAIRGEDQKKLVDVLNQALSKAQKKAALKMQGMMGNLSGLFGG